MSTQTETEIEPKPQVKKDMKLLELKNKDGPKYMVMLEPEGRPPFRLTWNRPLEEIVSDMLRDALDILYPVLE